jgi:hypothetical protein
MTSGPLPSATGTRRARGCGEVGRARPQRQCWAERARGKASSRESGPLLGQEGGLRLKREVGKVCFFLSFFFQISISF